MNTQCYECIMYSFRMNGLHKHIIVISEDNKTKQ